MSTPAIYKEYGFENMIEFFYYIVSSKVNGQISQVRELLTKMNAADITAFSKFETGHADLREALVYCKTIAAQVLAEKQADTSTVKTIDVHAKQWFDKVNGNSYFSVQVTINYGMPGAVTIAEPFQYGYGSSYEYAAFKALQTAGAIPMQNEMLHPSRYCNANDIIYRHNIETKCKKRDVISWGVLG